MDCCIFSYVGIATCALIGIKLLSSIIHAVQIYIFPTSPDFAKYGKWSVVTGATSGIGKSLAKVLASKGQNIVLISRSTEKLQEVAKEIESSYPVQIKHLAIDFKSDESIYEKIEEFVKELDVGVLVNNVGMASPLSFFTETENLSKVISDIVKVNVISVLKMTQVILPGMTKRKRGLILNISSASSLKPVNGFSLYGATKAMVNYFSKSISRECEKDGVVVQSVKPFFVSTNMTNNLKPNATVVSSDYYAKSLLGTIGRERESDGCWQHGIQGFLVRLMPESWFNYIIKKRMKVMQKKLQKTTKQQ